jgi:hypothetical protein
VELADAGSALVARSATARRIAVRSARSFIVCLDRLLVAAN